MEDDQMLTANQWQESDQRGRKVAVIRTTGNWNTMVCAPKLGSLFKVFSHKRKKLMSVSKKEYYKNHEGFIILPWVMKPTILRHHWRPSIGYMWMITVCPILRKVFSALKKLFTEQCYKMPDFLTISFQDRHCVWW